MKPFLTVLFFVLMLSANVLLLLFLFNRELLAKFSFGFFKKRELLVLAYYNLIQISPLFLASYYKPHIFMDHGISGYIFAYSGIIYPFLCLTIIPYTAIKRNYTDINKVVTLLICFVSLIISLFALIAGVDFQFAN